MLLRSSSHPVIKSLFSQFSGSPNRDSDTKHQDSISLRHNKKGFRRAFSDSNLDNLVHPDKSEELHFSTTPKKYPKGNQNTMLITAPSFSAFNVNNDEVQDAAESDGGEIDGLIRTVTIGESVEVEGDADFSFGKKSMGLIEEEDGEEEKDGIENLNLKEPARPASPPMYLASGLGIDGHGFGGGGGGFDVAVPEFDDTGDLEEYYKRMVNEYPCHPLFLANYAQLLKSKGDLHGAEEYYYRATLADPEDGDILLKYAKLEWQLHHNQHIALHNFQCAVHAAPKDSHVLAAYASFLWELDDYREEDIPETRHIEVEEESAAEDLTGLVNSAANQDFDLLELPPPILGIDGSDQALTDGDKGNNFDEYYKRMIGENPSDSLLLRNYAQFLYQSKGDLLGAEEYYSRALLLEPADGEIMSQYAKLAWEVHRDQDKASNYFERAVQAKPEDSYILAAYASFLWETADSEEL